MEGCSDTNNNNWFKVSMRLQNQKCTHELVAKHERSIRVTQGNSLLKCLATFQVHP